MIEFYRYTRCLENGVSARTTYSNVLRDNVFYSPCQKSPCSRIFQTTYLAKLLYDNHIINYKAIKNILSLYYV